MKKIVIAISILLLVFVVAGCKKKAPVETKAEKQGTAMDKAKSAAMNIKDAITKGEKMECTFKGSAGDSTVESKFYVQGDKYKSVTKTNQGKLSVVFDGKTSYTWMDDSKEGTKMDIDCINDLEKSVPQQESGATPEYATPSYKSSEDVADEAVGMDCQPVGSVDFSVPSDVNFVDQCEMMKQLQEGLKDLNPQMTP